MNFALKFCSVLLLNTHTIIVQTAPIVYLPKEAISSNRVQPWEEELEPYIKPHKEQKRLDKEIGFMMDNFENDLEAWEQEWELLEPLEEDEKTLAKERGFMDDVKPIISDNFVNGTQITVENKTAGVDLLEAWEQEWELVEPLGEDEKRLIEEKGFMDNMEPIISDNFVNESTLWQSKSLKNTEKVYSLSPRKNEYTAGKAIAKAQTVRAEQQTVDAIQGKGFKLNVNNDVKPKGAPGFN
eukprot:Pgem_evm1s956